jgi:hypothetical protein
MEFWLRLEFILSDAAAQYGILRVVYAEDHTRT